MFLDDHLTTSGSPRHQRGRRRGRRPRRWNTLLRFEPLEQRTVLAAVLATVPSQGGPQVDPATDISVYFDGPMEESTLTEDNITVDGSISGQHTAQLSYMADGFELRIDPSVDFARGETVTVTLTTDVKGAEGDPLPADYSFSFHTLRPRSQWEIDPPPSVLATSPVAGGPKLDLGTDIELVFGVAMDEETLVAPNILIHGEVSGAHSYSTSYNAASMTATLNPDVDFAFAERVTVTVTTGVKGTDGQTLPEDYSFSFRTLPPRSQWEIDPPLSVLATSPVAGGPKLDPGTDIELVFGVAINQETLAAPNIVIQGEVSGVHSYATSYNAASMTATLNPDTDFAFAERVTVTVTTGVQGTDGQTLPEDYSFSFRTHTEWTEADTPEVLATAPVQGGPMLAIDTPIEIYFNTPMDPATFTGDTITILGSVSGEHPGRFTYQVEQMAVIIDPDTDFAYDEQVTVTVTTGVADDDGDPLEAPYSFSFRTRPEVVGTQIVAGQTITTVLTWPAVNGPYLVTGPITVATNGSLTIEAGTVVKFNPGTRLVADGILDVQGTADNRVVFTSYRDDQYGGDTNGNGPTSGVRGDWQYINLRNSAIILDHSILRYAGQAGTFGLYASNASTPVIRNNVIEYCGVASETNLHGGIRVQTGSNPLIENNIIRGGSGVVYDMAIRVDHGSQAAIRGNAISQHHFGLHSHSTVVDLEGNTITGATYAVYTNGGDVRNNDLRNSSYPLYQGRLSDSVVEANTFTAITNRVIAVEGTLEADFVWDDVQGMGWPYLALQPIIVPSNCVLTIPAGTVVKFMPGNYLRADGVLDVQGTADERVVFTSYRDDQYAGDTNGDGASSGDRGDWYHVYLRNSSITFDNSIIRYAGQEGRFGLYTGSASMPVIRDSVLEYCGAPSGSDFHGGIRVFEGSNPLIENNVIRGGSGVVYDMAIRVDDGSQAAIRGNAISQHHFGLHSHSTAVDLEGNTITGATYAVYTNGGDVRNNDLRNSSYALYQGRRSDSVVQANTFTAITNRVIGVEGTLEADFVWDDIQGMGWPYLALQPIVVPSGHVLTIPAGAVVKFKPETYLQVDGVLDVQGTADGRVVFTSYRDDQYAGDTNGDGASSGSRGDWEYLTLRNDDTVFQHSLIRYAGRGGRFGLYVTNGSTPVIRDNAIEYCGTASETDLHGGIRVWKGANPLIENNVVRGGSGHRNDAGIQVEPDSDATILGNTISEHYFGLRSGSSDVEQEGNIVAGTTFAVFTNGLVRNNDIRNSNYALYLGRRSDSVVEANTFTAITNRVIGVHGTLEADFVWDDIQGMGWPYLALEPIVIPSNRLLTIPAGAVVKFRRGSYLQADGVLDVQGTADECVVFTSYRDDQYGGDTNGDGPSSGARGDWYFINLKNSAISFDHSIVRYAGEGGRFGLNASNASAPVIRENVIEYCGAVSESNWHGGIRVQGGSNPRIENNIIRGGSGVVCDMAIRVDDGSQAAIRGNVIGQHRYGLHSASTAVDLEGNTITGATHAIYTNGGTVIGNDLRNSAYALYQGLRADPIIEDNTFTKITYPVIAIGGTTESDFVWEDVQGMGWPYLIVSNVTVSGGTTLTMDPGIVVKFEAAAANGSGSYGASWICYRNNLIIQGTLNLLSSPGEEIVFTSARDDAYGGDSNGDGADSLPAVGDWGAIRFLNPGNVLHDVVVRYGGLGYVQKYLNNYTIYYRDTQMVWAAGSAPGTLELRDCIIENAYGDGVRIENPSAQVALHWVTVNHAGAASVLVTTGQVAIEYSTFNQFGHAGVHVTGGTAVTAIYCNFMDAERNRGVLNEVAGLTVHAEGSWWDDEGGPSVGVPISGNVAYQPWSTTIITTEVDDGPTIVSRPYLYAVVGRRYAYDADGCPTAVGNPPIAWSLVYGPPGFVIDEGTGEILWVPTSAGRYLIGIQATDLIGVDTQLFHVVVDNAADIQPPTVTDFSYELSGATEALTGTLTVMFSEPVRVDAGDIVILDQSNNLVEWDSYTYAQSVCRLTVVVPELTADHAYRLLLLDTITDAAYNPLDGEFDGHTFPTGNGLPGGDFVVAFAATGSLTASLVDGGLTIMDIGAAGPANLMTVLCNGENLVVGNSSRQYFSAPAGGTLSTDRKTLAMPMALIPDVLVIHSAESDDVLAIALVDGNPIPPGGLLYNGGAGHDLLRVLGVGTENLTYTPDAMDSGSGAIVIDDRTLAFAGVGSADFDNVDAFLLDLPGGNDMVQMVSGTLAGNPTVAAQVFTGTSGSIAFVSAHVRNVANVILDTTDGDGDDTITVSGADSEHGNTNLTILTGDGDDTVRFNENTILAVDGTLTIQTASLELAAGSGITAGGTGTGSIFLIADAIDLSPSAMVDGGVNEVAVRPSSVGARIDVGGDDVLAVSPPTLGLSGNELERITAANLRIGDSDSGTLSISAPIVRSVATHMQLVSGAAILFDPGWIDTAGGHLRLSPETVVRSVTAGTDVTAGSLSFSDGAQLEIRIDGTTVDTEYSQLNVAGTVDLTGASLTLSGSYSPVVGDTFTVVNNGGSQPVIGTFAGLPEGAVIADFLGSGLFATITYVGGDGNDVVLKQTGGPRVNMTIVTEPSPTGDGGEVTNLPGSADWVHEWQSFWVEIWVGAPDMPTLAVAGAMVDLQYDTDYLTALEIERGSAFPLDWTGAIDDRLGLVSGIGGTSGSGGPSGDGYLLLARVRFASTGDDQVAVVEVGRNIGPYDMQIALAGGQTELVGAGTVIPEFGESPSTELWAAMYDVDDNDQIDFGDLSYFAAAFGRTVGEPTVEPPFVWWADFDKSGRVDFGDLAFFAPNFNKSRSAVQAGMQTLVFPSNFPDAWQTGAGGGEGEAQNGGQGAWLGPDGVGELSSGGEHTLAGFDGWQQGETRPWQLARAVDEAHAALQLEQPYDVPEWTTAKREALPARRWIDDWEPLEDLLASLIEQQSDRMSIDGRA